VGPIFSISNNFQSEAVTFGPGPWSIMWVIRIYKTCKGQIEGIWDSNQTHWIIKWQLCQNKIGYNRIWDVCFLNTKSDNFHKNWVLGYLLSVDA
jgi:hypothetical protein